MAKPMEFVLSGGPQDGAKVQQVTPLMPPTIYVGRTWKGDGFAAYGTEKCDRFPCRYDFYWHEFVYKG